MCISSISVLHMFYNYPEALCIQMIKYTFNSETERFQQPIVEKLFDFNNNLSVRKENAGKKRRFEQDQPEAGDKKGKNRL